MLKSKKAGIIGLGKMGFRIAEHLLEQGYNVVGTDMDSKAMRKLEKKGGIVVNSLKEFAENILAPRIILIVVPAGAAVSKIIEDMLPNLSGGDIVMDLGNSFYKDS